MFLRALDELALRYGIALSYVDMNGNVAVVSDATKRGLLAAMGVTARTQAEARRVLQHAPDLPPVIARRETAVPRCFVPDWLADGRAWGVALQLYQLRSSRDYGIGDFADLAQAAIALAEAGADFLGTNPLHALFTADPERASPFSPSSRRTLNPLYIAVDWIDGFEEAMVDRDVLAAVRASEIVDYAAVARLKLGIARKIWAKWRDGDPAIDHDERHAFAAFRASDPADLVDHGLFEALSHWMVAEGHGAGWTTWPEAYRDRHSADVEKFLVDHQDEILFHIWLQFLAHRQLRQVQASALAAGMRIGLYLDLAVGTAPDGSATWADPELAMRGARIGAPPDLFTVDGQDWGLAPLSPAVLTERNLAPFRDMLAAVMGHAGAIRIDHAMGLERLYLIPDGLPASAGAYVAMPRTGMVTVAAEVSGARRCLVIGEDLGVVPAGFRELMAVADIQSYRILVFERDADGLKPPETYPVAALACLSTHDMPPLKGWWDGEEIEVRLTLGRIDEAHAEGERAARVTDKRMFVDILRQRGLLGAAAADCATERPLSEKVAVALHRYGAVTRSRLFAVRLEDLLGERALVNLPGTDREHPNWRRKLGVPIEEFADQPLFRAMIDAIAGERPRR